MYMLHLTVISTIVFQFTQSIQISKKWPEYREPSWITAAIAKDKRNEFAAPVSVMCQPLRLLGDRLRFPGQLCFVSIWADISAKKAKYDPRRKFCEALSVKNNKQNLDMCTWWDRGYASCHGEKDDWVRIGYIPTICPQYPHPPCQDFKVLHTGNVINSDGTGNQFTHIKKPDHIMFSNANQSEGFNNSDLGFIRTHSREKNDEGYYKNVSTKMIYASECPHDMIPISYFYNPKSQKSCTITTLFHESQTLNNMFDSTCGPEARNNTEFIGCIYPDMQTCLNALRKPEIIGLVEPKHLQTTIQIFIEMFLSPDGEEIDMTERYLNARDPSQYLDDFNDQETASKFQPDDEEIQHQQDIDAMNAAGGGEDTDLDHSVLEVRVTLKEFTMIIGELPDQVKLCTDDLFELDNLIEFLPPGHSLKFCMRWAEFDTYMSENGKFWLKFTPYFSAAIKRRKLQSSFGFEGGIEYKADHFVSHIAFATQSNWLPPWNFNARTDMTHVKAPLRFPRSKYPGKEAMNGWGNQNTRIALYIWWGIVSTLFLKSFKDCIVYGRIERKMKKYQAYLEEQERLQDEEHQAWLDSQAERREQYELEAQKLYELEHEEELKHKKYIDKMKNGESVTVSIEHDINDQHDEKADSESCLHRCLVFLKIRRRYSYAQLSVSIEQSKEFDKDEVRESMTKLEKAYDKFNDDQFFDQVEFEVEDSPEPDTDSDSDDKKSKKKLTFREKLNRLKPKPTSNFKNKQNKYKQFKENRKRKKKRAKKRKSKHKENDDEIDLKTQQNEVESKDKKKHKRKHKKKHKKSKKNKKYKDLDYDDIEIDINVFDDELGFDIEKADKSKKKRKKKHKRDKK